MSSNTNIRSKKRLYSTFVLALTTAQARPMVFPKHPNADKPEPAPKEVTMETAIPTKEETSTTIEDTSVSDKPSAVEVTKSRHFNCIVFIWGSFCLYFTHTHTHRLDWIYRYTTSKQNK